MKKSATRLFRIYTEDKNYEKVIRPILKTSFDGFSVYRGAGYWRGVKEKSLLIEVYTNNAELIRAIAERVKHHNKQEAVLVTETEARLELV